MKSEQSVTQLKELEQLIVELLNRTEIESSVIPQVPSKIINHLLTGKTLLYGAYMDFKDVSIEGFSREWCFIDLIEKVNKIVQKNLFIIRVEYKNNRDFVFVCLDNDFYKEVLKRLDGLNLTKPYTIETIK